MDAVARLAGVGFFAAFRGCFEGCDGSVRSRYRVIRSRVSLWPVDTPRSDSINMTWGMPAIRKSSAGSDIVTASSILPCGYKRIELHLPGALTHLSYFGPDRFPVIPERRELDQQGGGGFIGAVVPDDAGVGRQGEPTENRSTFAGSGRSADGAAPGRDHRGWGVVLHEWGRHTRCGGDPAVGHRGVTLVQHVSSAPSSSAALVSDVSAPTLRCCAIRNLPSR